MNRLLFRGPQGLLLLALLSLALSGCGSGREGVSGTVTLDGNPLASGKIRFVPEPGTEAPTSGTNIENGTFEMDSNSGLIPGKYRVEITATRPSKENIADPGEEPTYKPEQYLPARYNDQSELIVEINGEPLAPFELTSEDSPEP